MDTNENKNPPGKDNPLKKAAMAAIGAISGAVEKVADMIGEATSQENIDKMAKKGEGTYESIRGKSEDIFKRVKDFSTETAGKVKRAVDQPQAEQPGNAVQQAKDALAEAIESLRTMVGQSKEAISKALDSESFGKFTDDLSRSLKAGKEEIERLVRRVRELETEEDADAKDDDDADGIDESQISEPKDGEIVYMSNRPPKNADDKVDYEPTEESAGSPTAPDDENNTNKLKSVDMNDHIPQSVPPEY
jgi:polyhydroxyalkanoate synthesis regulator phasin